MSTIAAGTTTTTALVQTGDTTGSLVLQTGSTPTTAMTISSSQIVNFANAPTIGGSAFPSGAMTLISTQTASSSADLHWTGLSGYDKYVLIIENLIPATNNAYILLQLGTGSTTYLTSGYTSTGSFAYNAGGGTMGGGTFGSPQSGYTTYWPLASTNGLPNTASGYYGKHLLMGMSSGNYTALVVQNNYSAAVNQTSETFGGSVSNTTTKTAIKLTMSSGNITSGTASLYGISS